MSNKDELKRDLRLYYCAIILNMGKECGIDFSSREGLYGVIYPKNLKEYCRLSFNMKENLFEDFVRMQDYIDTASKYLRYKKTSDLLLHIIDSNGKKIFNTDERLQYLLDCNFTLTILSKPEKPSEDDVLTVFFTFYGTITILKLLIQMCKCSNLIDFMKKVLKVPSDKLISLNIDAIGYSMADCYVFDLQQRI